jgi:hypothetical protein
MKYTNLLFDAEETNIRLGDIVSLKSDFNILKEPINYFLKKMETQQTAVSHDLHAAEKPHFRTLNYASFSKCLMLSPLQPDLSRQQIIDAAIDKSVDNTDYVSYFSSIAKNLKANKYNEISQKTEYACEALVVLPGGNKLFTHICFNKIFHIIKEHGKLAVFKPHPLTSKEDIQSFKEKLGEYKNIATILDPYDDLYHYMNKISTKVIYTTHMSETLLYALCLGKKVEPIDTFQSRLFNSFSHLNGLLFMNSDASTINKIMSSPKSGIIIPELQSDYEKRIDSYIDYIHDLRKRVRYYYV